jgi:serine/threonine protein kinase
MSVPSLWIGQRLGRGAYSTVYEVNYDNETYAAKCNSMDSKTTFIGCICELNIASVCFNHPNIVKLKSFSLCRPFASFVSPRDHSRDDPLCLFFECADYNLAELLTQVKYSLTDVADIESFKEIAIQMLFGLEFMHRNRIVHRDIKPTNILIFDPQINDENSPEDITIKLCDFGLSKHYPSSGCTSPGVCTPSYRSIEICQNQIYNNKVDIWSLGCVFYEILSGHPLIVVDNDDSAQVLAQIIRCIPDRNLTTWASLLPGAPNDLIELISNMLAHDPKCRWSAMDCLNSAFFKGQTNRVTKMIARYPVILESAYTVDDNLYTRGVIEQIRYVFNNSRRCKWYSDRMIFIALNLAYKFTGSCKYSSSIVPNAPLHAMVMIYLAIKYLNTLETNPTWAQVVPKKMSTSAMMDRAKDMERTILRYLSCKVYSLTPYDLAENKLSVIQVSALFDLMTDFKAIQGKTPSDMIKLIK